MLVVGRILLGVGVGLCSLVSFRLSCLGFWVSSGATMQRMHLTAGFVLHVDLSLALTERLLRAIRRSNMVNVTGDILHPFLHCTLQD